MGLPQYFAVRAPRPQLKSCPGPAGYNFSITNFAGLAGSNLLIAGTTTDIGTELYGIALDTKPTNIAISNQFIAENSLVGTVVGSLTTQDLANLTYTYSLVPGQVTFTFQNLQ